MKRLFIIQIILFSAFNVEAQYQSILNDSSRSWFVYNTNTWHFVTDRIDSLYLGQWIQLSGGSYRELKISSKGSVSGQTTLGYLREDTGIGKAWFRRDSANNYEYEIYDLSLNQGDTLIYSQRSLVVDSVFFHNNRKHIKLKVISGSNFSMEFNTHRIYDTYDTAMFIEGVGSTKGFNDLVGINYFYFYANHSDFLVCAFQQGNQIYQSTYPQTYPIVSCDSITKGIYTALSESQSIPIEIFPNPTDGVLRVKGNVLMDFAELYSINSQMLQKLKVTKMPFEINIQGPSGVYFIKLRSKSGKEMIRKVLKK
ncbi:MAG: T9SS type A sorting domain-containing protein [Vicingaceae bacterium]